jgi:toxin-antitoxin system PIN domain toxin
MKALFDVNVLIALFDPAHVHHHMVHAWFETHRKLGWATCPITQNGCVRILAQPKYPNSIPVTDAIRRLSSTITWPEHTFWNGDLSIADASHFNTERILSSKQITDLYLLALVVHNGGRLVTFDKTIPVSAVAIARSDHLVVL